LKPDIALEMTGVVIELVLLGLLIWRRVWRTLPVFFVYCVWSLLSDVTAFAMVLLVPAHYGIGFYLTDTIGDVALQFCVLVEVAWSVLRPMRSRLSANALWVVAAAILAAGAIIWPLSYLPGLSVPSTSWRAMVQLQQTTSILRVLFFLLLAGCSQLLSLGWRDRELQVATGFGFYSLVSIAVASVNTHQATALQFTHLYRFVAFSFLCSLAYWTFSFARAEAKRREFSPKMENILLELAAKAHISCAALTDGGRAQGVGETDAC
jgi:hypothetical protein